MIKLEPFGQQNGEKIKLPAFKSITSPAPLTEYEQYKKDHPVISFFGGWQKGEEARILSKSETGKKVTKGAVNVVSHPISTIGGLGVGATEAVLGIEAGIVKATQKLSEIAMDKAVSKASLFRSDEKRAVIKQAGEEFKQTTLASLGDASSYITKNKKAIKEIFDTNMEVNDSKTAGAVGEFVGLQLPYVLASTVTAGVINPAVAKTLGTAGKLTLSQASTIQKIISSASNILGDAAISQIMLSPDSTTDERKRQLLTDILTVGAFEAVGYGVGAIKGYRWKTKARNFISSLDNDISQRQLEAAVYDINKTAVEETGKSVQELFQERIAGVSDSVADRALALQELDPKDPMYKIKKKIAQEFLDSETRTLKRGIQEIPEDITQTTAKGVKQATKETGENIVRETIEPKIEPKIVSSDARVRMLDADPEFAGSNNAKKVQIFDSLKKTKSTDDIIDIAVGKTQSPEGLPSTAVYNLVKEEKDLSVSQLKRLKNTYVASRAGAELQATQVSRNGIIDNPLDAITVAEAKLKEQAKKRGITERTIRKVLDILECK
jgi:hypothetical protein